jgi:hypothetical protein
VPNLDPATGDVREMAERLRKWCNRVLTGKTYKDPAWQERVQFAAALLAVLDECDIRNVTHETFREAQTLHGVIRAAYARAVAAGLEG